VHQLPALFTLVRRIRILRTSPFGNSPKFASLSTPNNQLSSHSEVVKILQLSDAPSTPLWCHGGRRYIKHKVEALNPALWKLGTQEGLGSQWCNRLPSIPKKLGEKGVVVGMCYTPPT
jgi:hypothetical protein